MSLIHTFLLASDENHRRLRRVLAVCFAPGRIKLINREILIPNARDLADRLQFHKDFDILDQYIRPYCLKTICGLTGLNTLQRDEVLATYRVAHRHFGKDGPSSPDGYACLKILYARTKEICNETRNERMEGDLTGLVQFVGHYSFPYKTSKEEMICLILSFFETVAFKVHRDLPITLLRYVASSGKNLQKRLRQNPDRISDAAEEAVRLQDGAMVPRVALKDTKAGGVVIPKGSRVFLMLGDTGKDRSIFPNPFRFKPWRQNVHQHLGFGEGSHRCIGIGIAKIVAVTALRVLLERGQLTLQKLQVNKNIVRLEPLINL